MGITVNWLIIAWVLMCIAVIIWYVASSRKFNKRLDEWEEE